MSEDNGRTLPPQIIKKIEEFCSQPHIFDQIIEARKKKAEELEEQKSA